MTTDYSVRPGETADQYKTRFASVFNPQPTQAVQALPSQIAQVEQARKDVDKLSSQINSISDPIPAPKGTGTAYTPPVPTAPDVNQGFFGSITGSLDSSRKNLENTYNTQIVDLKTQEDTLKNTISTNQSKLSDIQLSEYRQELETSERDRLKVEENFFANQKSTDELGSLLSEGNALIDQQRNRGGISTAGATALVNKTISDVNARAGVIEAVMAARNSQISVAENMIDRTLRAVQADKNDQVDYYTSLINAADKNLITLSSDKRKLLEKQTALLENDLAESQKAANYIKELMIDPKTAQFVEDSGVKLTDTVEQIRVKMAKQAGVEETRKLINEFAKSGYGPLTAEQAALRPAGTIQVVQDASGRKLYFDKPKEEKAPTTPKVDNLTLAERQRYYPDLPLSLVGLPEATVIAQLEGYNPPQWFKDIYPAPYTNETVQKEWQDFRSKVKQVQQGQRLKTPADIDNSDEPIY